MDEQSYLTGHHINSISNNLAITPVLDTIMEEATKDTWLVILLQPRVRHHSPTANPKSRNDRRDNGKSVPKDFKTLNTALDTRVRHPRDPFFDTRDNNRNGRGWRE